MNPPARNAVWAAALTGILFVASVFEARGADIGATVSRILDALILPGFLAAALLRLRGGVDGAPYPLYAFPCAFVIYWLLFEIAHVLWRLVLRSWSSDRD